MPFRIFVDTNILLDLMLARERFIDEAALIFRLRDDRKIDLYVSALSLSTAAYFARKFKKDPKVIIATLLRWVHVVELREQQFKAAVESDFSDFEDALQYASALEVPGVDAIVTRNKKDFGQSKIPVFEPKEFLLKFIL